MNILYGFTHKEGNFINDNRQINYNNLYISYVSDEDSAEGGNTVGWKCGRIKCDPDLEVVGAPDLVSLLYCPVYFVIDPESVGVNSRGEQKAPIVSTVIKAGEPIMKAGDPSSAPVEDRNKKQKKEE